jgi:hypothetical protein
MPWASDRGQMHIKEIHLCDCLAQLL